jgi:hypothetical protein
VTGTFLVIIGWCWRFTSFNPTELKQQAGKQFWQLLVSAALSAVTLGFGFIHLEIRTFTKWYYKYKVLVTRAYIAVFEGRSKPGKLILRYRRLIYSIPVRVGLPPYCSDVFRPSVCA